MANTVNLQCPTCPTTISVAEGICRKLAGRSVSCPICSTRIPVPTLDAEPKPPPPTPMPAPEPEGATPATPCTAPDPDEKVRIPCRSCGAALVLLPEIHSKLVGTKIDCLKCGREIVIPSVEEMRRRSGAPASTEAPSTAERPTSAPTATPAAPATPPAAAKKCFLCGTDLPADATVCTKCGVNLRTGKAEHGPIETRPPTTGKFRFRGEAVVEPKACAHCKAQIPGDALVCPQCQTDLETGKKAKPSTGPVTWWNKPRRTHGPGRKITSRILQYLLTLVILGGLVVLGYLVYLFIQSQFPPPGKVGISPL